MKTPYIVLCLGLMLMTAVPLRADLVDFHDGTIYDSDTHLSWLIDAGLGGARTWSQAMAWADTLNYAGFDDWRLPTTLQLDSTCTDQDEAVPGVRPALSHGYNCRGSEMGTLYYMSLGNSAGGLTNGGPFLNIEPNYYWSATAYLGGGDNAWVFGFVNGFQGSLYKSNEDYAFTWAVRDGQRSIPVPEPSASVLLTIGVTILGLSRLRKSATVPLVSDRIRHGCDRILRSHRIPSDRERLSVIL